MGQVLYKAHEAMRTEYEISCPEIDLLVELAKEQSYVIGARMMGGGFGGCTINIVEKDRVQDYQNLISEKYESSFGIVPEFYSVNIGNGVSLL